MSSLCIWNMVFSFPARICMIHCCSPTSAHVTPPPITTCWLVFCCIPAPLPGVPVYPGPFNICPCLILHVPTPTSPLQTELPRCSQSCVKLDLPSNVPTNTVQFCICACESLTNNQATQSFITLWTPWAAFLTVSSMLSKGPDPLGKWDILNEWTHE